MPRIGLPSKHASRVERGRRGFRLRVGRPRFLSGGASVPAAMPGLPQALIEPGVRVSRTELSDGFHARAFANAWP